jgi:SAM-dependent methyltransferase
MGEFMINSALDLMSRIRKRIFRYLNPAALDLSGDREIEYAFVSGHIPDGKGTALDFGCGDTPMGLVAGLKGYSVIGIDLTQVKWSFSNPSIRFIRGDINQFDFGGQKFDVILNCSTIEHVGLPGRYGSANNPDGDLETMKRLFILLKPGGIHLLTIPVGQDQICPPYHRIYGSARLPLLLRGFENLHEEFWIKRSGKNIWVNAERDEALAVRGSSFFYGLGLFILSRENPAA